MSLGLAIDVSYLCHRSFYAIRDLTWEGKPTGVLYGFLMELHRLLQVFVPDRIAFCFDGGSSVRRRIFPDYKSQRRHDPALSEQLASLHEQVRQLREEILPEMGFRNLFWFPGYESDDCMARLAERFPGWLVLVTDDSDLYQCLRDNTTIYSPRKKFVLTDSWFRGAYKIEPPQWAEVKAIAGCSTDGVPGVPGVGEKTAIRYIRGQLPAGSKLYQRILSSTEILERNRMLVRLPFPDTPELRWRKDRIRPDQCRRVLRGLGIRSLDYGQRG